MFSLGINLMAFSDKYALEIIKERIYENGGEIDLTHRELAQMLECHINTALVICKRLQARNVIKIVGGGRGYKTGYTYRLHND